MTQSQPLVPDPNGCETSPQQENVSYTVTMYDAVNIPSPTATQDEQTYNLLHRGKVNGQYLLCNPYRWLSDSMDQSDCSIVYQPN